MQSQKVPKLHRWLSVGAAMVLILLAVQSVRLGKDVQQRIEAFSAAATDNLQWTLSQAEVDYLKYQRMVSIAEDHDDLAALRRQFDIYYSRIATYRESSLYADMRATSEGGTTLDRLWAGVQAQVPLIDAPDDVLLARLPDLQQLVAEDGEAVRELALIGVVLQAETAGVERVVLHKLFLQLALVVVSLMVALALTALLILSLFRRGQRLASQQAQDAARTEAMVTSSLDAILVADEQGRITAFNGAAERIFAYSAQEVIGMSFEDLVAIDAAQIAKGDTPDGFGKGDGRVQLTATRKTGERLPVEVSLTVCRSGNEPVLVSYVRDISSRLRDEEELRRARDDALSGVKAKDKLLTVMSHEMRTPLTGILGSLDILEDLDPSAEQQKFLQAMRVSGELLLHHVNDVLELSRLQSGAETETVAVFDLKSLVQGVVDSQQATATKNNNELSVFCNLGPLDGVHGRARSLQQVLLNLVGNALKFTQDGAVSVDVVRGAGDMVEFCVADTGKGIAADDLERIFDDFIMLDPSYTRGSEGTGLGLAISQRLVRMMDGEISCESEPGEGSLFTFTLPLPPTALDQTSVTTQRPVTDVGQRLLVIEDNDINRLLLDRMLSDLGHQVVTASGGAAGVEQARAGTFDLILTDISMPEVDGMEVLRQLRREHLAEGIDVVALTAHASADDHARILDVGFAEVLTKPIDRDALGDLVRRRCAAPGPLGVSSQVGASSQVGEPRPSGSNGPSAQGQSDLEEFVSALGPEKAHHFLSVFRQDLRSLNDTLLQSAELTVDHRQEAHRLAGSAAVLGLADLRASMLEIEQANTNAIPALDRLCQACARADTMLARYEDG
ncbi:aerobic respiration control sensor protein ArcB [Tritonibacter horizontis]|uniref:histidine kinase n=2 Tax=Tritonibacter horizontis TaxID=1768241 RepID=A0A132BWK7_9RHOB|nr:aerobic respiration control sensor protein ArcB [Tritonibacter horizontis]